MKAGKMNPVQWRQVEDLYEAAENCIPHQRAALLECADPKIRVLVERMLELSADGLFLDQPNRRLA